MKKTPHGKKPVNRGTIIAAIALASVPLTALALYDTYGEFSSYVSVGGNLPYSYYSSSSGAGGGILMVGSYNGVSSLTSATNALVVGTYGVVFDSDSAVIGRWNKDTLGDELFILGNGTNSDNKSNAMEVFKNGTIRILRQGDISMGAYGGN